MKNVLLVGFGAVGAICSYSLKRSGKAKVTVVARSNYDIIQSEGMHYKSLKYGDIQGWRPDCLCRSVEEAANQSYSHVLVTTKAIPEILRTPHLLAPLLTASYVEKYGLPTFVLLQNGLNIEVDLYNALKALRPAEEPKLISAALYIYTKLIDSNVVEHTDFDRIVMGIYRPTPNITKNTHEETEILQNFEELFTEGGTEIVIVPEIQREKFRKNNWNCVMSSVSTLTRFTPTAIFRSPSNHHNQNQNTADERNIEELGGRPALSESQKATSHIPFSYPPIRDYTIPFLYDTFMEVVNLGQARFPQSEEEKEPVMDSSFAIHALEKNSGVFSKLTSKEKHSMLLDCEKDRPMEVEVIVGEVVRMGKELNVPMPRMEAIYALLLVIQMQLLHSSG
ncbi:hypothetical protein ABKN59_009275 [Abortiporus biennis]